MYHSILTELIEGTYIITINRPDKLNALNRTVINELSEAVDEIYINKNIKSAIITGAGPKAFIAGADISEFTGLDAKEGTMLSKKGSDIFLKIENALKPVIAAVNGFALGGGCELALACHFRICSSNAKFGQPEVNLGLIPGYGGTQRLTQLIGKGRAMELIMTGEIISAEEAYRLGVVNHIVDPGELLTKAKEMLQTIQSKAPFAISKAIECINISANGKPGGFEKEQEYFGLCCNTNDMKEGAAAFLEKRKPVFTGH